MPIVPKQKVAPHQLYGLTKVDTSLSMRERIKQRFRPTDTVQVRNITNQEISWQYMDEQDESYTIEDDTNIKITERDDPSLWILKPGEYDVLQGANAYLMIEALYKLVCVMKTGIILHPLDEREVRNFSFDDPERQEQFIDAVFKGKITPTQMHKAAIGQLPNAGDSPILENLPDLATEQSEFASREGRERRIVTPPKSAPGDSKELSDLANEFDEGESLLGVATGGPPTPPPAPEGDDKPDDTPNEPPEAPKPQPSTKKAKKPAAKPKKEAAPTA